MKAKTDNIKTFTINYVSAQDNTTYMGNFTIKKLSIRDLASLGVRKSQLNGGMYYDRERPGMGVDEQTDSFNNMIAHMEICVKSAPEWWNLDNITDVTLLGEVFKEVMALESSFLDRAANRATANGTSEAGSTGAVQASNAGSKPSQVVVQEVSASLEP